MKKGFEIYFLALMLIILIPLSQSCIPTRLSRELKSPEKFTASSRIKALKVHMQDGGLYILYSWEIDSVAKVITGTGDKFNYRRDKQNTLRSKQYTDIKHVYNISWDDITLIETNQLIGHAGNLTAITLPGVPLSLLAIYCIIDPKACFGSCPTFYTMNDGKWELVAEGFSSSILPVFEKQDIDMLFGTSNHSDKLTIKLTNEALETHAIRYANLQIFPRQENTRVYATSAGDFYRVSNLLAPKECKDESGSCVEKVSALDKTERFSLADSNNLAKREELIVSFANTDHDNLGLILSSRQTLLTTYLFYQGLAWSGNYAGYFASEIENGNHLIKNRVENLWDKLGNIEIFIKKQNGSWMKIGEMDEMGPIATDVHLFRLPPGIPANATFKLRMTQGLWRINHLALGNVVAPAEQLTIHPARVQRAGIDDPVALQQLTDTTVYLVTLPRDEFLIDYELPDNGEYEFFLQTKGYYLEWMRDEWLAEQNLRKAQLMFAFPGRFMRKVARDFKVQEPFMESNFWGSRYVRE